MHLHKSFSIIVSTELSYHTINRPSVYSRITCIQTNHYLSMCFMKKLSTSNIEVKSDEENVVVSTKTDSSESPAAIPEIKTEDTVTSTIKY